MVSAVVNAGQGGAEFATAVHRALVPWNAVFALSDLYQDTGRPILRSSPWGLYCELSLPIDKSQLAPDRSTETQEKDKRRKLAEPTNKVGMSFWISSSLPYLVLRTYKRR
jgi:hypothetical protein